MLISRTLLASNKLESKNRWVHLLYQRISFISSNRPKSVITFKNSFPFPYITPRTPEPFHLFLFMFIASFAPFTNSQQQPLGKTLPSICLLCHHWFLLDFMIFINAGVYGTMMRFSLTRPVLSIFKDEFIVQ